MATRPSILAWRIPWTEEPGRLQSMGSQRVGPNWRDRAHMLHACWHYSFEVVWWCLGWRTKNSTCYWAQTPAPGPSWPFPIIFILHLAVQGSLDCLAETPVLALASPSALPRGICCQEKALWALSLNLNPNTLVALRPPAVPLLSWCPFLTRKWGRHT